MLAYPGGTPLDLEARRYSLTQNFLSDLGMTVAYGGGRNRVGAVLFVVSLLTLVAGGVACLAPFVRDLLRIRESRPWAGAAATCVLLTCIAFTGVAFTPENRAMDMHIAFTISGWRIIVLLSLLLGAAAARAGRGYGRAAVICLITGSMIAGYSALFTWGPDGSNPSGRMVHVVAQKVAAVIIVVALIALARVSPRTSTSR